MRKLLLLMLASAILIPGLVMAASDNGQGATNGNSGSGLSSSPAPASSVSASASQNQTQTQAQVQSQVGNPETGVMTQTQTEEQSRIQEELTTSSPQYTPKNSKGVLQRSVVANAVQAMLQVANKTENQGVGEQIRTIAQTQSRNQDAISKAIDKAETRTAFAKFFIGANFAELKNVRSSLTENQNQIKQLEQTMAQLTSDTDKNAIANQIILLQQTQLELKDQVGDLSSGFSLFGWINRWMNRY